MKKQLYFVVALLLSTTSCEKSTESSDRDLPVIVWDEMKINPNDTIKLDDDKVIKLNISTDPKSIDTIVLGNDKRIKFTCRFTDNEALSGYKIRIDTLPETVAQQLDSVLPLLGTWSLYGQKDTLVQNFTLSGTKFQMIDSVSTSVNGISTRIPIREGDYAFWLFCLDKNGNEDSIKHIVRLLHRKTIIAGVK